MQADGSGDGESPVNADARAKRASWALLLLTMLVSLCGVTACGNDASASRTTETTSAEFASSGERLEFAGRYLTEYGPVTDVEFDISFRDNSGWVPGPSDWDMSAAYSVDPETVAQWIGEPLAPVDLSWAASFATVQGATSDPEFYGRDGYYIVIYRDEGIILLHSTTGAPLDPTDA